MAQHKLSDGEICLFLVIVYGLCHYLNYGSIIPVSVSVFTQCSSLCVYVSSWDLLYLCLYPNFPYFRRVAVLIRAHPNCIWPHLNLITSAKIPFPKKVHSNRHWILSGNTVQPTTVIMQFVQPGWRRIRLHLLA